MNTQNHTRRSGFTLIEMTVAVAIFLILLTIVLVPLRFGLNSFALGRARAETQGAIGASISDIERDLRRAVVVFPNSELAGVTSQAPYLRTFAALPKGAPYFFSDVAPVNVSDKNDGAYVIASACNSAGDARNANVFSNPSRIDILIAKRDPSGNLLSPVQAGDTLVSYYPRRLNVEAPYDPIDNPVVLFRAEMPFRQSNGTLLSPANVRTDNLRYAQDDAACSVALTEDTSWLGHNFYGEANLQPLTTVLDTGSHTLAMPRGLGLLVTNAGCTSEPCQPSSFGLVPESTFSTFDTDNDGKIDRVNISLTFTSFDAVESNRLRNNQPVGQQLRASRVVDLPNVR